MMISNITVGLICGIFCIMEISALEFKDSLLTLKVKPPRILPILSQNQNNRVSGQVDARKRFFIDEFRPVLDYRSNLAREITYEEDVYDNGQTKVSLSGNFKNYENITGKVKAKLEHKIMDIVVFNAEASVNGLYRNYDLSYDGGKAKFGVTWLF